MKKIIVFIISFIIFMSYSHAQLTSVHTDRLLLFKKGQEQYENNNLESARHLFERYIESQNGLESQDDLYLVDSKLHLIKIAFDLNQDHGENLVLDFEKNYSSHILLNDAYIAQGDYYFRNKDYTSAITSFEKVNLDGLNFFKEDKVKFNLAYSYFVKKQFEKAALFFKELSLINRKYYYQSHYYYGICQFLKSDFERAINSFNTIQNTTEYKQYVPYYLVQLHFTQGDYDKTIKVGEEKIKITDVKNFYKIHHLIGQSYFLKKDYESALPHLEIFEQNTDKLRVEDFYQLGYIYHQLNMCSKAIPALREISNSKNAMGQNANYYLADCYFKTEDKESARTAFKKASDLSFNNMLKEESLLNYGKLSAEMGYDREAISSLLSLSDNSPFYLEAQKVLRNVFVNTKDYVKAQETLEKLDKVSSQLFQAYQVVSYYKALQEINDGKYDLAEEDLRKAEKINRDIRISIQTHYWLADLLHRKGNFQESNNYLDRYFILIKGIDNIEELAREPFAYYLQGYNYYKLKNHPYSIEKFQKSISSFKKDNIQNIKLKKSLIADANLRIADGYFDNKQLNDALKYYDYVIYKSAINSDYAFYQKAIIAGLNEDSFEKISILEGIIERYKTSGIRPNTFLELGNTYNELRQFEKAYNVYSSIIEEYPDETNLLNKAYLRMGLISYNKGSLDNAIVNYKAVISNNPDADKKREALNSLEEIYVNDKKNANEYIDYIKTVPGIKIEGLYKDSLNYAIAKVSFDEDSTANAINSFNLYLEKYDQGYYALDAHYYRAESYLMNKKYRKALKDFRYIIKQGYSTYYESSLYKAAVLSFNHIKSYENALKYYKDLEKIVKDENKKYSVQLGAMRSAFRLNNYTNVNKYGSKILNNSLTSEKERSAAHYYIGKVAESNKKHDTSLRHLNKVIRQNRNSNWAAEARYLIAKIYFKRGEGNLSKKLIKEANIKNSAYPYWVAKGLILISDIFVSQNDLFNGRAALEAVFENYKEDKTIIKEVETKLNNIKELEDKNSRIEKESEDGSLLLDSIK